MMARESVANTIDQLARAPEAVREAIARVHAEKLRNKPNASVFSPLGDVWHLRDIEAEGYLVRIRRILAETLPVLEDLDGDRMAIERRYNELELGPAIAGFAVARGESLALLQGLPTESWMRQALFASRIIDLRTLIHMMVDHDRGHLSNIRGVYVRSIAA
jgi:DinB superfamily